VRQKKKIRQSSEREVSMHDYESETRVEPNKLYLYIRKKRYTGIAV